MVEYSWFTTKCNIPTKLVSNSDHMYISRCHTLVKYWSACARRQTHIVQLSDQPVPDSNHKQVSCRQCQAFKQIYQPVPDPNHKLSSLKLGLHIFQPMWCTSQVVQPGICILCQRAHFSIRLFCYWYLKVKMSALESKSKVKHYCILNINFYFNLEELMRLRTCTKCKQKPDLLFCVSVMY